MDFLAGHGGHRASRRRLVALLAVALVALVVAHCSLGLDNYLSKQADHGIALVVGVGACIGAALAIARQAPRPRRFEVPGVGHCGQAVAMGTARGRARSGPEQARVFRE